MKHIITILLVVALLALAGCKEGPATEDKTTTDTTSTTTESKSESGFVEKFADFTKLKTSLQYSVTYDVNVPNQQKYTMSQYFGGEGKMRADMKMQQGEARTYILGSTFYSCNNMQGSWMCMKIESQDQDTTQQFNQVEQNPEDYDIDSDGTMSVAGTTAICFKIDSAAQNAEMRECFSKEGVPLYMKMTSQGMTTELKATRYSASVKASDFELPAKATDVNEMMKQYGANVPAGYQ